VEQRATVTDSAPPRFAGKMVGSAQLLLLFSAGGANHCHLQKETQNATTIQFYFVLFLDLFPPVSSLQLWVCNRLPPGGCSFCRWQIWWWS
jgi:hypothetical protein